jgi:hypothetical protein
VCRWLGATGQRLPAIDRRHGLRRQRVQPQRRLRRGDLQPRLGLGLSGQHGKQRRFGLVEDLGGVDRAQQLQEAVIEQQDACGQRQLRLGTGSEARQHCQRQLGLDAFLAGQIGSETCSLCIVGGRRAVAGQQLRLALEAPGQPGARRRQRRDRLAAGIAPAEPDVQAGAQRLHDGAGRGILAQHLLHVGEQPGPVEGLQAQREEVLGVGRARRRGRRRQQHAPPQLMQRRRARRQLEARQQLLERLEVE